MHHDEKMFNFINFMGKEWTNIKHVQQINCGICLDVVVGQCPTRKIILKFLAILEL
jgi:hypothetical protein